MTTMVAIYYDGNRNRAVAVDVGTGGSNAEVWKAVSGALGEGDTLMAIVEGARGTDAFCMIESETEGQGDYVTLAPPRVEQEPADHALTDEQRSAKAAALAKPAKKASAKKTKGA